MSEWGDDRPIPRWPKPSTDEPIQRFSADFQEFDGSWTAIVRNVPLREAISAARRVRAQHRIPPETRVR